jgi:hypothetical protein
MLRIVLSGFQMGYDMGLGGCWPAEYYLARDYQNWINWCCYAVFFCIIYIPMYGTCLPLYLHAYIPKI